MSVPCPHPTVYDRGECCGKCPTTQQDSVDVERLVERIIREQVGDVFYDDVRWLSNRQIVEQCVLAALSLPITQRDEQGECICARCGIRHARLFSGGDF